MPKTISATISATKPKTIAATLASKPKSASTKAGNALANNRPTLAELAAKFDKTKVNEGEAALPVDDHLLTAAEAAVRVGISRPLLYRLRQRGAFPEPRYITPTCPRWTASSLVAWMHSLPKTQGAA